MLAGHAKLPQGMAASDIHQTLTVTLETDLKYWVILNASCTLATEHAQKFLDQLLKGHSLLDGLEAIIKEIEEHYYGKAQSALVAAVKDAYKQYNQINLNEKLEFSKIKLTNKH
ncbi:DUF3870 domain-containing protein [Priestia aryabhattai]|uniref:DUF3870 domain-containing protein n=1 Tax=Priestia TaxID=2800373 RepID=UPI000BEF5CD3|nr:MULTISPECIES: DUF3870 domain-containing protein [Priestia]AWD68481.1 DUF3870 domain-containing protein [Priestia megaterium]MBY0077716.1 DUF3870 domain-containing protein [Priestia aryabhattai]MBY0211633.1 DUF3870 domain-containing protein [Priestia aryabhattai]MDT0149294.1 DUF3870 domain-containing protein [Priestia aryabhattai]MDT0155056.1 DUF3870 domain-containing protein [Priestia aryabhattai]